LRRVEGRISLAQLYSREGGEFVVNTTTAEIQATPAMVRLASGGSVIVWFHQVTPGALEVEIRGQMYDADGNKVGGEFAASPTSVGYRAEPRVSALADGGFVVTWTYDVHDGTGIDSSPTAYRIKGQVFDGDGTTVGGELAIGPNTTGNHTDSQVVGLAGGGFAVSWTLVTRTNNVTDSNAVVQVYDAAGTAIGPAVTLANLTAGAQNQPALTALAAGGFVATWADSNSAAAGDNAGLGVKAQLFDAAGAKVGGEILVNSFIAGTQYSPSVALLASGGFVVTWLSVNTVGDNPGNDLKGQIFDVAGAKVGGEFLVNTSTDGHQTQPHVTGLTDGSFVVAWRDQSTAEADIRAQVFDSTGAKAGFEFVVNSATTGAQTFPVIAALAGGGFEVAWMDAGAGDGSLDGIKAQRFVLSTSAPTDIALSNATLNENAAENVAVATLSSTGTVNGGFTYSIVGDSSGGAFRIEGDQLVVDDNAKLDFETAPQVTVTIRTTDANGQSYDEAIVLDVTDIGQEARYSAGSPFLANVSQAGSQGGSTLVPLATGGFALIWSQFYADVSEPNPAKTMLRFFDADGAPASGEIVLATEWLGEASVIALAGGGFMLARTVQNEPAGMISIKAQAYDSAGNAVGAALFAGSVAAGSGFPQSPDVVQLSSGGYLLAWSGWEGELQAQRFDSTGAPVGPQLEISPDFSADRPALTATPSGGFAVAWWDDLQTDPDGDGPFEVHAQFFDASGAVSGAPIVIPAGTFAIEYTEIVALAGGGYVLGWVETVGEIDGVPINAVMAQLIDSNGAVSGEPLTLTLFVMDDDSGPDVSFAAHPDGGFLVTWPFPDLANADFSTGQVDYSLNGQLFDASGSPVGPTFQPTAIEMNGSAAILADGAIVTSWTGFDNNEFGVFARVYHAANTIDDILTGDGTANVLDGGEGNDELYGLGGADDLRGGTGNDLLDGGAGSDLLRLNDGGNDSAVGGAGNDVLYFGGAFTGADQANGGADRDVLILQGDYALTLSATNLTGIESISIQSGARTTWGDTANNFYDYAITMNDANATGGLQLIVNAQSLRAGEDFTFDGSAETGDGKYLVYGGHGVDTLKGGAGADVFFFEGARFQAGDSVDGGAGRDALIISGGNGLTHIEFAANALTSIESISLNARFASDPSARPSYELVLDNGNVAPGATLIVNGSSLADPAQTVSVDGSAVHDGNLILISGAGADTLKGGDGADLIQGGLGVDTLTGGSGVDTFRYTATGESTAVSMDRILDFASGTDKLSLGLIDADSFAAGDQAFHWIGGAAFAGNGAASAGELRAFENSGNWFVEGDVNGDGLADLVLQLTAPAAPVVQSDFLL
jgi:Ca2+-binding RTX toxin-like protein